MLSRQKLSARRSSTVVLGCSVSVLLGCLSAHGASQSWDGGSQGDALWSTVQNWLGDPTPPGSTGTTTNADVATFNTPIANTWGEAAVNPILFDLDRNLGGIDFTGGTGNYFLGSTGGNALKLSSGGAIRLLSTLTATNAIQTINAPLEIQGADGTYTLSNDSANGSGAGAGTLRIGGGITTVGGNSQLLLTGSNTSANTISGLISEGAATPLSLRKTGTGNWTLTAANTYTGSTNLEGGTLTLAFGGVSANILPSSNAMTFQGGTLRLTGTGSQTLNGLATQQDSANRIILDANETLNLGAALSLGSGSVFNFDLAAGGANGAAVGTGKVQLTGLTAGAAISVGYTVSDAGGFGLATVNGSDQIVRLTTTALLPASGSVSANDYRLDNHVGGAAAGSSTLAITASQSVRSLTVETSAAAGVLTLNPGVVFGADTWNFGGLGSNSWRVAGSASGAGLQAATPGGVLDFNDYNAGTVRIDAPILDNGTSLFRLRGNGRVILAATNTYAGNTLLSGGGLEVATGGSINSPQGTLVVGNNPGEEATLAISGGSVSTANAYLGKNPGSKGTVTISGGTWNTSGTFRIGDNGTGVLNITGGTVITGSPLLGAGVGSSGTLNITGGTFSAVFLSVGPNVGSGVVNLSDHGALLLSDKLLLGFGASGSGTFNYGTGGTAPKFQASLIIGGPSALTELTRVNLNFTGLAIFPKLDGRLSVTKQGSGRAIFTGDNTYRGTTTISEGEILFRDGAVLAQAPVAGFDKVTVAPGASFGYAATKDEQLRLYHGLYLGGGPGTVLSTSIGSGTLTAQIQLSHPLGGVNVFSFGGAVVVNIYGITGVPPLAGTNTYSLMRALGVGVTFFPARTLGLVLNNSDFTVGGFSTNANSLQVAITRATPITSAHWVGGFSGAPTMWAASDGSTTSNWAETAGGAAQPLTPGPGATVTLASLPATMTLGAAMGLGSVTIADTTNGLHLAVDGFTLKLGSGGLAVNAGVPASEIAPDVILGVSQTWTNNSANPLTISGSLSGAGVTWTKAGAGTVVLSGDNPYTGVTNVTQGTLLVDGSLYVSVINVTGAGTTFGGTGRAGPVTVGSGAILQGGDGPTASGTLSFGDNNVSLLDGSVIRLTLGAAGTHSSLSRTNGTWTFDSDQAFTFAIVPGATAGFYDNILANLTGTETGLDTIGTWQIDPATGVTGTFTYDGAGGVDLNVSVIPEPGSAALLLLGLPLLGLRPRRFRATNPGGGGRF